MPVLFLCSTASKSGFIVSVKYMGDKTHLLCWLLAFSGFETTLHEEMKPESTLTQC